jgi:hypothetical protein
LAESVLLAPEFFKLSVQDHHTEMTKPNDKIEVGDRLRVYETGTMKPRSVARAVSVNTHRRTVTWEKEIGDNAE